VYWRYFKKRLLFPDNSPLEAHIIMQQDSSESNQITLSKEKRDIFGQPLAVIDWSISEVDINNIFNASIHLKNFWKSSSLNSIGDFDIKDKSEIIHHINNGDGIHHPSGSTRMASNSLDGVVDKDLKLFSIKNTRILSTSVFPTGGGANPTMTLFMLALRLADQIEKEK
jgi:choline dehydrogenase-like flavoprotein